MKLTAKVKLQPTREQVHALKDTIERANAACNAISDTAWNNKVFEQYRLHKLVYYGIKDRLQLAAQMVVRCISKVADAYKLDRQTKRTFRPHGSIAYDSRILKWKLAKKAVSIWTVAGRQEMPFVCGERQWHLLPSQHGETDLVLLDGTFYLLATCIVADPDPSDVRDVLGVDLGIVNLTTDSDGDSYSGSHVNALRARHRRLRTQLQSTGTKSAKRLLKKRRRKESRFANDLNHCISKALVAKAQRTASVIVLEELTHIRKRTRVRKPQQATYHSWAFADLRQKIAYKAALAGVMVIYVDPRYTSQTCPVCGAIDKRNRPSQALFSCMQCGFAGPADAIAAMNLRERGRAALVNQPDAVSACR